MSGTGIPSSPSSHIAWIDPLAATITLDKNTTSANTGTAVTVTELDYLIQAQDSGADYWCTNGGNTQNMTMPASMPVGWTAKFYTTSVTSFGGKLTPETGVNINGSTSPFTLANRTPFIFTIPGLNNVTVK